MVKWGAGNAQRGEKGAESCKTQINRILCGRKRDAMDTIPFDPHCSNARRKASTWLGSGESQLFIPAS